MAYLQMKFTDASHHTPTPMRTICCPAARISRPAFRRVSRDQRFASTVRFGC